MPQSAKSTDGFYEESENRSPASKKITMPQLPGNEDGRLARWFISENERVKVGDTLAEIETASATHEIEATAEGVVEYVLIPAGRNVVRPGTPLVLILPAPEETATGGTADSDTRPHIQVSSSSAPGPARSVAPGTEDTPNEDDHVTPHEEKAPMRTATYGETLGAVIKEEMRREPHLFIIGHGTHQTTGADHVLQGVADEFGQARVIDVPIAEDPLAGVAIGAALGGLKPIVVFSNWTAGRVALAHIVATLSEFARIGRGELALPIVFRAPTEQGATAAWLSQIPGLTVAAPSTPAAAQGLMRAALRGSAPVAVIESPALYAQSGDVPDDSELLAPFGKAQIAREGTDVSLVAYGEHVTTALEAAEIAAARSVSTEIIDLMTLVPLDTKAILRSTNKTQRLLTLEEPGASCAIGQRIVGQISSNKEGPTEFTSLCVDDAVLFAKSQHGAKPPADVLAELITAVKTGDARA